MTEPSAGGFSLVDLKALAKPASKLIDATRGFVWAGYEPVHIVLKSSAKALGGVIEAKGKAVAQDITARARTRRESVEVWQQENCESIVGKAISVLPESVSETPVSPDWTAQFFDHCQNVSDEDMQTLWAKILAGEVARPGQFSPKTLALVRTMRKEDALLFAQACRFTWSDGSGHVICRPEGAIEVMERHGLRYGALLHLAAEGLLLLDHETMLVLYMRGSRLSYFGQTYEFTAPRDPSDDEREALSVFNLSRAGSELVCLSEATPVIEYRNYCLEQWKAVGLGVAEVEGPAVNRPPARPDVRRQRA